MATVPRRLVAQYRGAGVTEVLLVDAGTVTLIAALTAEEAYPVLDQLAADYPDLPLDIRPGAVRAITT